MKLATKLTLLLLLLTILPLSLVGYTAYTSGRSAIERETLNRMVSVNLLKEDEFSRWIEQNRRTLEELARRPHLADAIPTFIAGPLTQNQPETRARFVQEHLQPILEIQQGFLELFILHPETGQILVSTDPVEEGKFREQDVYFLEGKRDVYVQSVYYSLSRQEPTLTIAAPMRDASGNLVAVLAGHIDLADMSAILLQRSGAAASEESYLVDRFYFFVTDTLFQPDSALKKTVRTAGVEDCLLQNDNTGFYDDYRGVPVIAAYEWLDEWELCMVTKVDQAEALAPIRQFGSAVFVFVLILALIVSLVSFLFTRTLTAPLERLIQGVEAIGQGELDHRIDLKTGDEIGQLAAAFDRMTANLRRSTRETAYGRRLLLALSQAAQAVQRAHTTAEVYRTVGAEVERLGYLCLFLALSEDGSRLRLLHLNIQPERLSSLEKLTGLSAQDFSFPVREEGHFQRILSTGEAVFSAHFARVIGEAMPPTIALLSDRLATMTGAKHCILVPLQISGAPYGVFLVAGSHLSESDLPAVSAFANQTAIALENAHLHQEILDWAAELEERVAQRSAELAASEERYRLLFERNLAGVFQSTLDGQMLACNQAYATILGYDSPAEVMAETSWNLYPRATDRQAVLDLIQEKRTVTDYELRLRRRDGSLIWVLENVSLLEGREGAPDILQGTLIDITRRKEVEESLASEYAVRQAIDDSMRAGVVSLDSEGVITSANPAFCHIVGWAEEELLGMRPPFPFWPLEDAETLALAFAEDLRGQPRPGGLEARFQTRDGATIHALVLASPLVDQWGVNRGLVAVVYDVTEQVHMQVDLRLSEERFRSTFEQAAVGIAHVSLEGGFLRINQRFCEIVGYSVEEMLALTFQEITHPDDLEADLDNVGRLLAGEIETYAMEKRYFRKDGSAVWVNLTVSLLRRTEGDPRYFIAVVEDIGSRKELEAALAQYREQLEQMVEERTEQLRAAQEQLVVRERLAVLGQLAGGVGHELRNPLGAIRNTAYFLEMTLEEPDAETAEMVEILQREVANCDRIVSSLLDFARPKTPQRRPVHLSELVQGIFARRPLPSGIEIENHFPPALPIVQADPDQLEVIFGNLIRNAAQAMPGGGRLRVEATATPDGVTVAFRDTGVGMAPETLEHLFEPLFTTKARGMGLGLALSKQLVEAHEGRLTAESQEGVGSTFTVWLPA